MDQPACTESCTCTTWRLLYAIAGIVFGFLLRNHGQVPGTLIGWRAVVVVNGLIVAERVPDVAAGAICVFPGRDTKLEFAKGMGPEQAQPQTEIQVNVRYIGFPGSQYRTFVIFCGLRQEWRITSEDVQ